MTLLTTVSELNWLIRINVWVFIIKTRRTKHFQLMKFHIPSFIILPLFSFQVRGESEKNYEAVCCCFVAYKKFGRLNKILPLLIMFTHNIFTFFLWVSRELIKKMCCENLAHAFNFFLLKIYIKKLKSIVMSQISFQFNIFAFIIFQLSHKHTQNAINWMYKNLINKVPKQSVVVPQIPLEAKLWNLSRSMQTPVAEAK